MLTRDELREELRRFPTREELRANFPARDELRQELGRFPTRDELREELTRFPTRDELRQELSRFATRGDLAQLREETASAFADQRRYMEILYEDLKGTLRMVLDTIVGRLDARDPAVDRRLDNHEHRLTGVEGRITRLEHGTDR